MPIRRPFVQLNLERPAALTSLDLLGPDLSEAQICLTSEDPATHIESTDLHKVPLKHGKDLTWSLPASTWANNVTAIKISAQFKGDNRQLVLLLGQPPESKLVVNPDREQIR
jgi:hypothetical protein